MEETTAKKSSSASATTSRLVPTVDEHPHGAIRAWCTVFGSALLHVCAVGTLHSFGVYQDYYTTKWLVNYSASDISWIGSVQVFFELALGILSGKLVDAGYCRPMLIVASILFSFSYFMLSFVKQGQYYQGIGLGIPIGLFFVSATTLSLRQFKSEARQVLAVGITTAGGSLGAMIYAIMLNYLFASGIGFAWSIRAAALLSAVCLLVANLMITIPPRVNPPPSGQKILQESLFYWPYILIGMSGFSALLTSYFPLYYVQLFAVRHGIPNTLVFYSLAIVHICSVVARISVIACVKKFGTFNLSIISCALGGCVMFGMLGCYTPAGLVLFSVLYGTFFGTTFSLFSPLVAQVAPSKDTGKVLGYTWSPISIAAVSGPPLGAALVGNDYVWWRGILFAALGYLVAAALQLVARELHVRHLRANERESPLEQVS